MSQTTCRYTYTAELPNGQTCSDQHLMMKFQAIEQKSYQNTEWKIGVDQKLQALLDFLGASRPMATPSGLPTNQSSPPNYYGQGRLSAVRSWTMRTEVRTRTGPKISGPGPAEGGPDLFWQVQVWLLAGPDLRFEPGPDLNRT